MGLRTARPPAKNPQEEPRPVSWETVPTFPTEPPMPLLKTLLIAATRQAVHTVLLLLWLQFDPGTVARLGQVC